MTVLDKKSRKMKRLAGVHCGQCGQCCCNPTIELTHRDLHRLVKYTNTPADRLVAMYSIEELDADDHHEWIRLSYGKRIMGLKKKRNGDCIFLSSERHCTAYQARPMSCRIFPMDIILDDDNRISDITMSDVVTDKYIHCRHYRGAERPFDSFSQMIRKARNETVSYWKKLAEWNRSEQKGGKPDFLGFLGF